LALAAGLARPLDPQDEVRSALDGRKSIAGRPRRPAVIGLPQRLADEIALSAFHVRLSPEALAKAIFWQALADPVFLGRAALSALHLPGHHKNQNGRTLFQNGLLYVVLLYAGPDGFCPFTPLKFAELTGASADTCRSGLKRLVNLKLLQARLKYPGGAPLRTYGLTAKGRALATVLAGEGFELKGGLA
jgi:hypothetical protein